MGERLVADRHAARRPELAREPALGVVDRPPHDRTDVLVGQRLESPDAQPREQGGIHLEIRILGRRAR